ncbi:PTS sugar transporter subunit IIB [Oceanivirga miroungae]|uniref:PTS system lactose/cellobiose-specific transporter subunit IIB n=1 Tax=Oceanivirga miroungae TaxID=1130046 RepID=A0A6I8MCM9_9FUSO|nr:PTS sugar transporter subunit IIB [Oceanivirga miroungae]VWL85190.1 PTS system lactose/cellobiose-specific transporter subunit IIB [Oceanivirga miroungae]
MKKILLICTAGMSTSFLVNKMKSEASNKGVDVEIEAIPEAKAKEFVGNVDVVLLGPQIQYLLNDIKEIFNDGTPVDVINMVDYGTMNGKKVLEDALEKLNK